MNAHGPYATREQAHAAAFGLHAAINAADPGGLVTDEIRARRAAAATTYIDNSLDAVGVELDYYDAEIIDWLAAWDPGIIQVVLAWARRAHAAAEAGLRAEIDMLRRQVNDLETKIRHAAPVSMDFDALRDQMNDGGR